MPPDHDDTTSATDDQTQRWVAAIALLIAIHAACLIFTAWYVHLDERGFLLGGCYDEFDPEKYGFTSKTGPCPPDRPYADVLGWVIPIGGLLVASFLPPIVLRIPMDGFSDEGGRNFVSWLILCVLVPVVLVVVVTLWFTGG